MPSSTKGHGVHVELKPGNLRTFTAETTREGKVLRLAAETINSQHGGAGKKEKCYMVTRLAWIAAKLVSSNSETRYASAAS